MKIALYVGLAIVGLIGLSWLLGRKGSATMGVAPAPTTTRAQDAAAVSRPAPSFTSQITRPVRDLPGVGGVLDSALNDPWRNVTSGNWGGAAESVLTAGLSDLW